MLHEGVTVSFQAISSIDEGCAGCSGAIDNLLIDRTVTPDCYREKRNFSKAWVDVKKAYDSVDHGWLKEMMVLHRFSNWLREADGKLCGDL